jgi:SAM-dependent methyltransferase
VGRGDALDLGCGAGRDTRWLLQQGFRVTAVDQNPDAFLYFHDILQARLTLVQSSIETFTLETYNLINAQWSLPFIRNDLFEETLSKIKQALRPNGVFTGQFFGIHDTWNTPGTTMTFCTREQAQHFLDDLSVITFWEEDKDGETALGQLKHWHIFHFIARKLTTPSA